MFATLRRHFLFPCLIFCLWRTEKLNSTVERYLRSPTLPGVFVRLTEAKERKESFSSDDTILEALGMAEGLAGKVDLILAKLSKLDLGREAAWPSGLGR